ncbi:MAG: potassium transporter [Cycloclasticus sp. symbiont of Bathymodiolus heckerae]|nr:MAG: potassium transporter [Cycloclasticus sp. symbiont of Bathymodiolus heckerae]
MHFNVIRRISGLLLGLFSITMLPPIFISYLYEEQNHQPFIIGFFTIFLTGGILWATARNAKGELRTRDGFVIATIFWLTLGLSGAIPFYVSDMPSLSLTDAIFESISGLTTTGATVITGLDSLPKSILFYRQQLQWFGGMGIIVLAVAILPMLGIGGMQLYKTETPGPVKDAKLTPRITETAKALWEIYLGLTIACALAYWFGGMSLFDAITHSFSTVSIGGFSTHDASFAFFDSSTLNYICIGFMFVAGINFALHFKAAKSLNFSLYTQNSELKAYSFIFLSHTALICFALFILGSTLEHSAIFEQSLFQVVSFATTSGFTSTNHSLWPSFIPVLLIFVSFYGGCGGSTAGGIKVVRILIMLKQLGKEITHLIHPHADMPVKLDHHIVSRPVINAVWSFFSAYILSFGVLMILMMITGLDQVTAFSAVAATLNNLGPGLGDISSNYASIPDASKWIACFAMLLGRLEIFTLLVLFSPVFWRD